MKLFPSNGYMLKLSIRSISQQERLGLQTNYNFHLLDADKSVPTKATG
jgi:hypothetical protein